MANLDVQKKKSSAWIWIVLLLVLIAAVVIFMMGRDDAGDNRVDGRSDTTTVNPPSGY